jgi:membrane fusion protein, multidrug efflux system
VRRTIGILGFMGLVAVGPACSRSEAAPKAEPAAGGQPSPSAQRLEVATRVEVAVLGESGGALDVTLPGEVTGSRDARLAAPAGGLVEKVFVEDGDRVKKGQVLAHVDALVRGVQLELASAELEQSRRDLERARALAELATEAERERAATQVRLLETRVKMARLELGRATITAPFAGVVANVAVEPGEVVAPGAPVVRLVQLDPIEVNLSVPDRDVVAMTVGTEVSIGVGARAGLSKGKIVRVSPAGNLETRAFSVEVAADNADGSLLPGMIANVRVSRRLPEGTVVIPQDWLVTRLDAIGVFVDEGGTARWRSVEAREVVRDQVVIQSGVAVGDRIVIVGHRDLAEGDRLLVSRVGACCKDGRAVFTSGG